MSAVSEEVERLRALIKAGWADHRATGFSTFDAHAKAHKEVLLRELWCLDDHEPSAQTIAAALILTLDTGAPRG